jgi:hypothetical protein
LDACDPALSAVAEYQCQEMMQDGLVRVLAGCVGSSALSRVHCICWAWQPITVGAAKPRTISGCCGFFCPMLREHGFPLWRAVRDIRKGVPVPTSGLPTCTVCHPLLAGMGGRFSIC